MEKHLDSIMDETLSQPGVFGCVFVDHQGFCLGTKGTASGDSAGLISALAERASRLEPDNVAPVITLETDEPVVTIQLQEMDLESGKEQQGIGFR